MKEYVYRGVIVILLLTMLGVVEVSHKNYMDLLEVNDQMLKTIEQQGLEYETNVEQMEQKYTNLETEYAECLKEKHLLEKRLGETDIPIYDFTEAEIYLLAQCVEAEAGCYENHAQSQRYVTQVILNRLHSSKFPSKVEEVIYQRKGEIPQFSVAYNGMIDDREVEPETLANVYSVIVHGTDLPEYVCYFYSENVTENWVNTLPVYDTVEGTVFAYESKEDY